MRLNQSLALVSGLLFGSYLVASPVYAVNCGISYYCYRSMTPGPAPTATTPTATRTQRPTPAQPTAAQPPAPRTTTTRPQTTQPSTARPQTRPTPSNAPVNTNRPSVLNSASTTPPTVAPARTTGRVNTNPPTSSATTSNTCSTLKQKIAAIERQATVHARERRQTDAQRLFKVAEDLRKEAERKSCAAL